MPVRAPVTAGVEINTAFVNRLSQQDEATKQAAADEKSGYLPEDSLDISKRARSKQQQTELDTKSDIEGIAQDVIRVSSTIGKAKSAGNLSAEQAAKLYKEIAALL